MRRLVAIVAASLTAALAAVAAPAATRPRPSLRLTSQTPVIVAGQHFLSRERVRLVPSNGPAVSTRASRAGSFEVTLSRTLISRCGGFSVRASGTRGSVASLKLPRPACMPVRAY